MGIIGGRPNPIEAFHGRLTTRMANMPEGLLCIVPRIGAEDDDRIDCVAAGAIGVYGAGANVAIGTIAAKSACGVFVDLMRPGWQPIAGLFIPNGDFSAAYGKSGASLGRPEAAETAIAVCEHYVDTTTFDFRITQEYQQRLATGGMAVGIALPRLD